MMQLNPITLSFAGKHRSYEADFRLDYFSKNLTLIRVCHLAAVLLLVLWTYVDFINYPALSSTFLTIRFAVVIPLFGLGLLFSYSRVYVRFYQLMLSFYVLLVGCSFIWMTALTPGDNIYPQIFGITVCYIFNYTFIRSRFVNAAATGTVMLGLSAVAVLLFKSDVTVSISTTALFCLGILHLLGMAISYSIEHSYRRRFYLNQILAEERDKQIALNEQLKQSMQEVKVLRGILPICAKCTKIRDDGGYWHRVEEYLAEHSEVTFTHGLCKECQVELYPEMFDEHGEFITFDPHGDRSG